MSHGKVWCETEAGSNLGCPIKGGSEERGGHDSLARGDYTGKTRELVRVEQIGLLTTWSALVCPNVESEKWCRFRKIHIFVIYDIDAWELSLRVAQAGLDQADLYNLISSSIKVHNGLNEVGFRYRGIL